MKTGNKHFWALIAFLVFGGAVVNFWEVTGEARVPRQALREFPSDVGDWKQSRPDGRFDAATEAVLRADDYVQRDYSLPDGRNVSLYIGYYGTQRTGATYHSPLNCLPGAGWTLIEPATVQIKPASGAPVFEANRYIVENGSDRQLMIYWYQGRGRAVASEYWDKVYTVLDSARRRRSDGAMVRVMMPVGRSEQEALETTSAFAGQIAPELSRYVPD
ncbi:MAG TPA: EpsI family protein [Pyrinomonadaceae bacterium]|nr:EpsI family protein [Pyrinomonadaceae bacterium]